MFVFSSFWCSLKCLSKNVLLKRITWDPASSKQWIVSASAIISTAGHSPTKRALMGFGHFFSIHSHHSGSVHWFMGGCVGWPCGQLHGMCPGCSQHKQMGNLAQRLSASVYLFSHYSSSAPSLKHVLILCLALMILLLSGLSTGWDHQQGAVWRPHETCSHTFHPIPFYLQLLCLLKKTQHKSSKGFFVIVFAILSFNLASL